MKIFPISRFIVTDKSMEPVYMEGDHVLTFNWVSAKVGDAIVFFRDETFYIKRIYKIIPRSIFVRGDNRAKSTKFLPVQQQQIVGKVILKY